MDDKTRAKALMAAGLFILAVISIAVVLVVLPAIRSGGGSQSSAVAQGPPGGMMSGRGPGAGKAGGGMPGMGAGKAGAGMPGMGGGKAGGGMPMGGGAPAAAGPAPEAAAAKPAVEPLEKSRPNPFALGLGMGLLAAKPPAGLAFTPSYHTMTVGVFQEHQFPIRGAQGQSIKVPVPPSRRLPTGPPPPQEEWIRVAGVFWDSTTGVFTIILVRESGAQENYSVGDRFTDRFGQRWTIQSISPTEVVLSRQEQGKTITRRLLVREGGGTPPGVRPGIPGQPIAPGGGGQQQPGIRRPGGVAPGGFPGIRPRGTPGGQPQGAPRRPGGAGTTSQ